MSVGDWIALTLVGGLGAVARLELHAAIDLRTGRSFPFGTFAVNVLGSFVLGVLTGAHVTSTVLFVVGTGFLGAFTTFSTWMLETERSLDEGETAVAMWNLVASVACGLAFAGAGWALGALL